MLSAVEDLRQKEEGGQLDIEFDKVKTDKAVADRLANFKNTIGMITTDLLDAYFFYWKDQDLYQRKLVQPHINSQFHTEDTSEHRASDEKVFEVLDARFATTLRIDGETVQCRRSEDNSSSQLNFVKKVTSLNRSYLVRLM